MRVTRGHQSTLRREWTVTAENGTPERPAREWRATSYWCLGSQRMEWLVEVYINPPQHTSYWRRVSGHEVRAAVMEFENNAARLSA